MKNPPPSSEAASRAMRGNAGKDTGPERLLRHALRDAGMPGYRLQWPSPAGRIDVAYPGRRVAVMVHGCFWHRCPQCDLALPKSNTEFWQEKFARNIERDTRMRERLTEDGWTVLTLWECELKRDIDCAVDQVRDALTPRPD